MKSSYEAALEVLTTSEKDRLLCVLLNSVVAETQWEKAAKDFDAESVDSMKASVHNAMEKVQRAMAAPNTAAVAAATALAQTGARRGARRGKKRSHETGYDADDEEEKSDKDVKMEDVAGENGP